MVHPRHPIQHTLEEVAHRLQIKWGVANLDGCVLAGLVLCLSQTHPSLGIVPVLDERFVANPTHYDFLLRHLLWFDRVLGGYETIKTHAVARVVVHQHVLHWHDFYGASSTGL